MSSHVHRVHIRPAMLSARLKQFRSDCAGWSFTPASSQTCPLKAGAPPPPPPAGKVSRTGGAVRVALRGLVVPPCVVADLPIRSRGAAATPAATPGEGLVRSEIGHRNPATGGEACDVRRLRYSDVRR